MTVLLDDSSEVWQGRMHLCNQGTLERTVSHLGRLDQILVGCLHNRMELGKNGFPVIA